jgi:hypothetical protein
MASGVLDKSPDAFRTISEVAEDLNLPQHVLRFWETRFSHIRPLKRGGGRRYYRPDDIDLLKGIRHFLYQEGYTIKRSAGERRAPRRLLRRAMAERPRRSVNNITRRPRLSPTRGEMPRLRQFMACRRGRCRSFTQPLRNSSSAIGC